jgi:beta-glucosidase
MEFPKGFTWGAASSAYQIEGGANADGKGASVWDAMCAKPGAVFEGHHGSVACDHYHNMPQDVAMMSALGLRAYRFSISWPRVIPNGIGAINEAGLSFYDRLVDELLASGIEPWATLFHWDFPQELYLKGGWLNRASVEWFAEYAGVISSRLADRVKNWMTINEPQIFLGLGHHAGTHAPGLKLSMRDVLLGGHHVLMAHGRAVQAIRAGAKAPVRIGWAPCGKVDAPATDGLADHEAALRSTMSVTQRDCWNNTWWADPVCLGTYPEDGLTLFGGDAPKIRSGDMALMRQPLDFYGLNIYSCGRVRAGKNGRPETVPNPPGTPTTSFRWPITPECLYWGSKLVNERYRLPIVITENGMSNLDWVMSDGKVHDPQRIDYTRRHLIELHRAIADGVDVRGYFHWSIMDNFEWAEGYRERFGLVHVDYATLERTPKESAYWYRDVIRSNGRSLTTHATPAGTATVRSSTFATEEIA